MQLLQLDGAQGEGGGQILRTALTLSMITGQHFRIVNIRARRRKPGLLRQHLTAVKAAAQICGAEVSGAEPGSAALTFTPGDIKGGGYRFAIGTAGSCTLVLQTVLPALWFADAPSRVSVSGGTHNPAAPPADFLIRAWMPLMHRMGVEMKIELVRHGFYPAGGGEVSASVTPVQRLEPLELTQRGERTGARATAILAGVPGNVAKRELARLRAEFGQIEADIRSLPASEGPGNALLLELCHEQVNEVVTGFGQRGIPAESVAGRVAAEARRYDRSTGCVGEYLADQLALPFALAGGGRFTTSEVSSHLRTNLDVIERFLPIATRVEKSGDLSSVSFEMEAGARNVFCGKTGLGPGRSASEAPALERAEGR